MVEFLLILSAMVVYFAPTLVAAWVRHPKLAYIAGVNAALGITGIGWAGALYWALRRRRVVTLSYHGDMQVPRSFNTKLAAVVGLVIGVAVIADVAVDRLQARHTAQLSAALYAADVSVPAPKWTVVADKDIRTASLQSSNSLSLPQPFKGGPAVLSIVRNGDGPVVRLDVDGEPACSYAPTATTVDISFDSGPSQAFACAPAPAGARKLLFDGDHSTAYLADPVAFLARLKNARHISINATFARMTDPQAMDFDLPPDDPTADVASRSATVASAAASSASATPADAAAVPAAAQAVVSPSPAVAGAAEDAPAPAHHHKGHKASESDDTYVDGVPARGRHHGRHHHRG